MTVILGIVAVLCLLYYIVIVAYSGFGTSFVFVWLIFAVLFGTGAVGLKHYHKYPYKMPLWIPVSMITVCVTGVVIFVIVEFLVFAGAVRTPKPGLDYLVVLGAKVQGEAVSNSLKKRLDRAIEYLEENPDTMLVLSGGKGDGEDISEAQAMHDYLKYNGVEEYQMVLEDKSRSTVENIVFSYNRILAEKRIHRHEVSRMRPHITGGNVLNAPDKPMEIGILTSNFHVFRAEQIAKKRGIEDVHGIASDSDPVLFVHLCVRECMAILKDKLMGNM